MFKVISTFSGCGGSSLGYQLAGGKVVLAVEWDNHAVETYKLNFPDTDIFHGDISKLGVEEVLKRTNLKPRELDIFDGSPPCQGFSMSGKRILEDSRNQLYKEYVRLLQGLKPKVFVMENVSGMVKGKMKLTFAEIMRELKTSGYRVKARLLNAMYYNVPQSRERIIFIGVREDLGIEPSYPKAQTLPKIVRVALQDIKPIRYVQCKGWALKVWDALKPGQSLAKVNVDFIKKGSGFGHEKISPIKICPTIKKNPTFTKTGLMHWKEKRSLAIEEIQVLASFPNTFCFIGTFDECWARIGNCVPPNFMRAIAEHIRDNILR